MNIKRINAAFIFIIIMLFTISAAPLTAYAFRTEISDTVEDLQFQKNNTEKYYLGETIKAGDDDGYAIAQGLHTSCTDSTDGKGTCE